MDTPAKYGKTYDEVFGKYNESLGGLARSVNAALMTMYPHKEFLTKVSKDAVEALDVESVEINTIINGKQITLIGMPDGRTLVKIRDRESLCVLSVGVGEPLAIEDIKKDPFLEGHPAQEGPWESWLSAPVFINHTPVGTVCALGTEPKRWTDEDRVALEGFAKVVGTEVEKWSRKVR